MIGQMQIFRARLSGQRPPGIAFEFGYPYPPVRCSWDHPERALQNHLYPTVTIAPEEVNHPHDLRFVTGCRVQVVAQKWSHEFIAFGEALAASGATVIAMMAVDECLDIRIFRNGVWRDFID